MADTALDAEMIFREYGPGLLRYIRMRSPASVDPDDVYGDLLLSFVQGVPYRDQGNLAGFLFSCARHKVIDHIRQARTVPRNTVPLMHRRRNEVEEVEVVPPDPHDQFGEIEAAERVEELLDGLPEPQRHLLELTTAGYQIADIAAVLSLSEGAVRTLKWRARQSACVPREPVTFEPGGCMECGKRPKFRLKVSRCERCYQRWYRRHRAA